VRENPFSPYPPQYVIMRFPGLEITEDSVINVIALQAVRLKCFPSLYHQHILKITPSLLLIKCLAGVKRNSQFIN
jgi:hypothetical protein